MRTAGQSFVQPSFLNQASSMLETIGKSYEDHQYIPRTHMMNGCRVRDGTTKLFCSVTSKQMIVSRTARSITVAIHLDSERLMFIAHDAVL